MLPCESFRNAWRRFARRAGFEGVRPYALRHTFATINLARGENVKTISVLLGHTDASYTLDLYVGFTPAATRGLATAAWEVSCRASPPETPGGRGLLETERIFDGAGVRCCILTIA